MAKKHPQLNENDLVKHIIKWAKQELDNNGIDDYSIYNETGYAIEKYLEGRFDEAFVEYRVKRLLGE